MKFIAFDLETTGTVPGVDKIVEIGAVKFNNGVVESVFSTLVDPQKSIPPGASAVNGITDDMVFGKPLIDSLLGDFAEFCEDLPMVAHNAPFDSQFLMADIKRFESPAPRGVVLDTLPISRKVFPGLANYKLGTLVQHLKIPSAGFHRAEEDATYCGHVFIELIKRISVNGKPPELENLVSLTGKPEVKFPQIVRQP
ncbi:MAG: polymerase alpha subunit, partial [Pseudobdellovibrio sp.]|nr:polymerase alpha subunit [Pseudobdellovibrio sp.]